MSLELRLICSLHLPLVCVVMRCLCQTPESTSEIFGKSKWYLTALPCKQSYADSFFSYVHRVCESSVQLLSCRTESNELISFDEWRMSKRPLVRSLPVDNFQGYDVRFVRNAVFAQSNPTPFANSRTVQLVAWADDVISGLLDLEPENTVNEQSFRDFVSGNVVHHSSLPLAHRYGGHQFGVWAGQLGDGRAHMLGEYVSLNTGLRWELQLKGSGKTPFSRDGDGRAVLRSSIREFLASEAMHHLAIPTSRAATVVVSSDRVMRDPLYNGRIRNERTAVVLRVAQSWFRFGSFEILADTREVDLLRRLADFVITHHYPEIDVNSINRYAILFDRIVHRVAHTTAQWLGVGFVHGVLNTDNMSLLGLTIDYGPFQFVDYYDPDLVSNGSDDERRYRLSRQPEVVEANLRYLLVAMATIMSSEERSQASASLRRFRAAYRDERTKTLMRKLGLEAVDADENDAELVESLLRIMSEARSDFTTTFRQLSDIPLERLSKISVGVEVSRWAVDELVSHAEFQDWIVKYVRRCRRSNVTDEWRLRVMQSSNPRYILRNWMAEDAIRAAENDDFTRLKTLARILERPFAYQPEAERLGYADRPPSWAANITVTCSS